MLRYLMLLLTAVFATACTTPQERAARMQAEMESMIQIYGPACGRLGYPANSDQWRNCILQLSVKDELDRYGNRTQFHAGYGRSHWRMGGFWGPYW